MRRFRRCASLSLLTSKFGWAVRFDNDNCIDDSADGKGRMVVNGVGNLYINAYWRAFESQCETVCLRERSGLSSNDIMLLEVSKHYDKCCPAYTR